MRDRGYDMEQRPSRSMVQDNSFRLAVQLVGYIRRQQKDHVNLVLTGQLLQSGTSIGTNVEEALGGHSSRDFVAKLAIAANEAWETRYWVRCIRDTQPHDQQELADLLNECDGLVKMLNSIILTTRSRLASSTGSEPKPRTQNSKLRTWRSR